MTDTLIAAPEFAELEKARLDFNVLRVQFFLGFLCALSAFWLLFAHASAIENTQAPGQTTISERLGSVPPGAAAVFPGQSAADHLLNAGDSFCSSRFSVKLLKPLIYSTLILLSGLILLEIFGKTGNRLGAVPAIWSMLLFAVLPNGVLFVQNEALTGALLNALFLSISLFAFLRFDLTREKKLLFWAVLALGLFLFEAASQMSGRWGEPVGAHLVNLFGEKSLSDFCLALLGQGDAADFRIPFFLVCVLGLLRFVGEGAPLRLLAGLILSFAVIVIAYVASSGAGNSTAQVLQCEPFSLCARLALCILLALLPWRASGPGSRDAARKTNLAAIVLLGVVCLEWLRQALSGR